jgi:hypothetical protein
MKTNNNTPAPAKIETMADVYALAKFMQNILGAAYHPEDLVKDYIYTDEQGNTRPSFAPEIADRLQKLLDQAADLCAAKGVDICAIRCANVMAAVRGYDLDALNAEFSDLLNAHADDTEVLGASREEFAKIQQDEDADPEFYAVAFNAWDELCSRHDGLRESGFNWFAGASFVGYPNPWDLYIGDGEEPYIF